MYVETFTTRMNMIQEWWYFRLIVREIWERKAAYTNVTIYSVPSTCGQCAFPHGAGVHV